MTAAVSSRSPVSFSFTVPGPPVPCARARVYQDKRTGKTRAVTPSKTRSYEAKVAMMCRLAANLSGWEASGTAEYQVSIVVFRQKRAGDWDNFAKAVTDGMKGTAWEDDRQVTRAEVVMYVDRKNPRVEVMVWRRASVAA
jgi:crossover junction endodeoxyribonuclease RusA